MLVGVPGLTVVVRPTPADAAGLKMAAIDHDDRVVFTQHPLLADYWLDQVGARNPPGLDFDAPIAGARRGRCTIPAPTP
jgi:acetoin:2,6-dichlorophenolindophenol oxidoreductase subunit beta